MIGHRNEDQTENREKCGLTLRGMTSLVTRKRSRWKSDTTSRKAVDVHWDRYVAKLWKFWKSKGKR